MELFYLSEVDQTIKRNYNVARFNWKNKSAFC